MSTTLEQSHQSAWPVYRRLLQYVYRYRLMFILGILGTIAYSCVDSSMMYGVKLAIDDGFMAKNSRFIHWLPYILLLAFFLRSFSNILSTYCVTWVGRTIVKNLREEVFAHLLKLPAETYDTRTSGSILSVIIYNVEQIAQASTDALITLVREGVFVAGLITVMILVSWRISLMFLLIAPFIAIVVRYSSRRTRGLSKTVQALMGNITQVAEETIEGYRIIRTFGGEQYEQQKFNATAENNRKRELKVTLTNSITSPIVQMLAGAVIICTVILATNRIATVSAGGYATIIAAMLAILKPMKNLATVNVTIQRGVAAADSIFTLIDEPEEKDSGQKTLARAQGLIQFDKVSFAYPTAETLALNNISFTVNPGDTVALVGRSGSGKSTLVSLLPRFYDTLQGTITVDAIPIHELSLQSLRQQFALVSQQIILFNDTIFHNIAYGCLESATPEAVMAAAKAAHADDFIQALPQGYQTIIGDKGLRLSGGQRQRIAIARAILKNAPILILDEATSALDTESERHIQAALENLMKSRTTLVIAHRLSTIKNATKIIVLDRGHIVEVGTHESLLANEGIYSKLYQLQFQQSLEEMPLSASISHE